jgi:hypothetical protein
LLLGWTAGSEYIQTFWDMAEEAPGFWIIQREIKKAVSGKPFFINDERGKPERLEAIEYKDFIYYYRIWSNYHYFGLPHNQGWYAERDWLLEFLKRFENAYKRVESFFEAKAIKG